MKRRIAIVSVIASLTLATAACGGDEDVSTAPEVDDTTTSSPEETTEATEEETTEATEEETTEDMDMDPAAGLVGPGCAAYAEAVPDGAGSVSGMAEAQVAEAASNNPLLTTLTATVTGEFNPDVNLVDTLNGDEFTVFAPVDEAFAAVDEATLETLKTDAELLTTILTYHVVPGQLDADAVVGTHETAQGGTLEVTGEGDTLMVNDASVICGNVKTANATVYLIDSVLMPPSM